MTPTTTVARGSTKSPSLRLPDDDAGSHVGQRPAGPALRQGWRLDAACRGHEQGDIWHCRYLAEIKRARSICSTCPVRRQRLEDALRIESQTVLTLKRNGQSKIVATAIWGSCGGVLLVQRFELMTGLPAPPKTLKYLTTPVLRKHRRDSLGAMAS